MIDHYVSYECAKRLRALGFRWKVDRYYTYWYESEDPEDDTMTATLHSSGLHDHNGTFNNPISEDGIHYSAPRLDQAAAWLREAKGIDIEISPVLKVCPEKAKTYNLYLCYFSMTKVGYMNNYDSVGEGYSNYESAHSAGIDKALELLGKEESR